MPTEIIWDQCEDCVKLSNNLGIGKLFCPSCRNYVRCSTCNTKHTKKNKMSVSDFDRKPLCEECKGHQCAGCGAVAESEDPTDEEFYWIEGILYCEDCTRTKFCNQCSGYCNFACPVCEFVHDCECGCTIECSTCGKEFDYDGNEMYSRDGEHWNEAAKKICSDCWEKMHGE
jgi:hypothetical protein